MNRVNFHPMPKRFMVWDKENKKFLTIFDDDGLECVKFAIHDLHLVIEENGVTWDEVIIIQSTNLFDKDGEEIFEGSLIVDPDEDIVGIVTYDNDEGMFRWEIDGVCHGFECGGDYVRVVGHILSNPELLEENE